MPWGWECRSKLLKQVPAKPVERRKTPYDDFVFPGPGHYDPPEIYCGKGFSKIKRAPAYSFGYRTPLPGKPAAAATAKMVNIRGLSRKGGYRITHSIIRPALEPLGDKTKIPGPLAYVPRKSAQIKRPPAYSIRIAAKPPFQPWDMWTPGPNMYWPPIPSKKPPAYSLGDNFKDLKAPQAPGPGDHDPKFEYVRKTKPAYSLGPRLEPLRPSVKTPAPNTYCEKKFMVGKPSSPAPSFGIRHTPYLGKTAVYLRPSKLEILAKDT